MVVKGAWTGPYADCNGEGDTKECAPCFRKRKCFLDPEKLYYSRCESRSTTIKTSAPTKKAASTCRKCGTNKGGKRSCCGRGGSWFGKCGDEGDSKFDHTWADGMRACKSKLLRRIK